MYTSKSEDNQELRYIFDVLNPYQWAVRNEDCFRKQWSRFKMKYNNDPKNYYAEKHQNNV